MYAHTEESGYSKSTHYSLLTTYYLLLTTYYLLLTLKLKRNLLKFKRLLAIIFYLQLIFNLVSNPPSVHAYSTNMSASLVLGQTSFTTNTANNGGISGSTLSSPRGVKVCDGKLVVADNSNNRVLVWNSIPSSNGQVADVVIGQPNFTSSTANNGGISAATISGPWGIACANGKLFISDSSNKRVLIYNSIPTTNGASADVVVGQTNMTSNTAHDGNDLDKLGGTAGVVSNGTKLIVLDDQNQRFLVFNAIPTSNGASADVVVGSNHGEGCTADRISGQSMGIHTDGNKLFIATTFPSGAHSVKIWNTIPSANNQSADVVVGQPNFTTCTATTGTASGLSNPFDIATDFQGRMMVADRGSQRVLIFNSIPTSNGVSANLVLGQSSFSGTSVNQGQSSPGANTFSGARGVAATNNKIIVSDGDNNRILIFDNVTNNPGVTLNNSPEGRDNGQVRLKGTVILPSSSSYTISSVQYSINGGSFAGAIATDGSFSSTSEEFYFEFDPKSNQPKDSSGNLIDGYTVRVKAINTNLDETDRLFYFQPFNLNEPVDNTTVTTNYPSFEFSVNKQRENIRDNLSKYQIQVRKGGSDSTTNWETLIDDIPVDFRSVKNERNNKQWEVWGHSDTNNGVYETDKLYATYSDESSRIKVYSKINSMSGTYQWKVVAVDKSGHEQETGTRNLFISATSTATTNYFPLAILNISGLGNPYLNSYNPGSIKSTYYTSSSNPIFYGIAWTNSKVTLKLTDQNCKTDCTKTYSTIANVESHYGINIPKGDLQYGKKYTANLSVFLENNYNELPQFTLNIRGYSSSSIITNDVSSQTENVVDKKMNMFPSLSQAPFPTSQEQQTNSGSIKHCIWFICW